MKLILFSAFLLLASMSKSCDPSIEQGIVGQVRWLEGNLMPTISDNPDEKGKDRSGEPVQRELHIYELTGMNEATASGPFFRNIQTDLVKKIKTDEEGKFQVSLPAGSYSVFVVEEEGLFASVFDGEGNINPVEVKEGELSEMRIEVNYRAAY